MHWRQSRGACGHRARPSSRCRSRNTWALQQLGWFFEIFPWQAEKRWLTLPEFRQRVLDASNSVAPDATDWQTACVEGPRWTLVATAAIADMSLTCLFLDFFEVEAGGAPRIREQDSFAKTRGETPRCVQGGRSGCIAGTMPDRPVLNVSHEMRTLVSRRQTLRHPTLFRTVHSASAEISCHPHAEKMKGF